MKRVVSLMLIMSMLLSMPIMATEEVKYEEYAQMLEKLGVFKGTGNGFELEKQPTRIEGLVMLIRMLGVEADALLLKDDDCVFDDVPGWGKGYVNYAYANGLTNGVSTTKFGSFDIMLNKSYVTFLLRALQYNDSQGDFSWGQSLEFAKSIGLIDESLLNELVSDMFLRDHVAKCSYNALLTSVKGEDVILINQLISIGAVKEQNAVDILDKVALSKAFQSIEALTINETNKLTSLKEGSIEVPLTTHQFRTLDFSIFRNFDDRVEPHIYLFQSSIRLDSGFSASYSKRLFVDGLNEEIVMNTGETFFVDIVKGYNNRTKVQVRDKYDNRVDFSEKKDTDYYGIPMYFYFTNEVDGKQRYIELSYDEKVVEIADGIYTVELSDDDLYSNFDFVLNTKRVQVIDGELFYIKASNAKPTVTNVDIVYPCRVGEIFSIDVAAIFKDDDQLYFDAEPTINHYFDVSGFIGSVFVDLVENMNEKTYTFSATDMYGETVYKTITLDITE